MVNAEILKERYYKLTYFEQIFLLYFLNNVLRSKLNRSEFKPSEIIEEFFSEFYPTFNYNREVINDVISDINNEIDLDNSINEIFKEIKTMSMDIFLQIKIDDQTDKHELFSFSKITESLSDGLIFRRELLSLMNKLNKYFLKINDMFIIRIFEILLFYLHKFSYLHNIITKIKEEEKMKEEKRKIKEETYNKDDPELISDIINSWFIFINFIYNKENKGVISILKDEKKLKDKEKYKYNGNDVMIIKNLDKFNPKFIERFKAQDSFKETKFQYLEKFKYCDNYKCRILFLNNVKNCPSCKQQLKEWKQSFIIDETLYGFIKENEKRSKLFELLVYLKIREIVSNLIPFAFIIHNIKIDDREIDILIYLIGDDFEIKKVLIIECKEKDSPGSEDKEQLFKSIFSLRDKNIDSAGLIIYLGETCEEKFQDLKIPVISLYDEQKIKETIINYLHHSSF
jgi:hypothetical protein